MRRGTSVSSNALELEPLFPDILAEAWTMPIGASQMFVNCHQVMRENALEALAHLMFYFLPRMSL